MKMIIVIIKDSEADSLTRAMTGAEYRVTRVASTGGFLRSGVATLLIGVEDTQIDPAIEVIRKTVSGTEAAEKKAMLFVVPVQRYEQV